MSKLKLTLKLLLTVIIFISTQKESQAQNNKLPCSNPVYRQFDFWVGQWNVYDTKSNLAGSSKVSIILDSCVVLEEWTSAATKGFTYAGKSFNTYNAATNQWQQTWVDNSAGTIEFLNGTATEGKIVFLSRPFNFSKDTLATRRLTFTRLDKNKVRQFGEISKDNQKNWQTEYDLEYRRKED